LLIEYWHILFGVNDNAEIVKVTTISNNFFKFDKILMTFL